MMCSCNAANVYFRKWHEWSKESQKFWIALYLVFNWEFECHEAKEKVETPSQVNLIADRCCYDTCWCSCLADGLQEFVSGRPGTWAENSLAQEYLSAQEINQMLFPCSTGITGLEVTGCFLLDNLNPNQLCMWSRGIFPLSWGSWEPRKHGVPHGQLLCLEGAQSADIRPIGANEAKKNLLAHAWMVKKDLKFRH